MRSTDFAKTLESGRQVVLTKTFQYQGGHWYEMIDSNQGPVRLLHLSATELRTMLQENGIAFRPEDRATPVLLR